MAISLVRGFTLCVAIAALAPNVARAQIPRALGLDISAHQGVMSQTTWNNIRNVENRQFVIIRASRGGTTGQDNRQGGSFPGGNTTYQLSQRYDDPYFIQNINRATTAGMFAGTYHRSRADVLATTPNSVNIGGTAGADNTGTDDANHFIQMAGPFMRPGYLPPVLDFEDGDGFRTDQEMATFALDFGNRIYEVMGIRPAIYTNGNYAQNILAGGTLTQRNELAQQSSNPPSVAGPTFPTLWNARWPGGSGQPYPADLDIQTDQPKDTFSNIYGPWDDYGVQHPWVFWQYASGGRLQSFNNGNQNLDFNVAQGGIEFVKDQLIPAVWWHDSSGDWSTLLNWNSGQTPVTPPPLAGGITPTATGPLPTPRLPGAAGSGPTSGQHDTVILERPNANITVTLSTGTHNIRKLYAREALDIVGGSLTINYVPSADSTPMAARFSAAVSLGGTGSLSVHTLDVDATRTFTVGGGTLTANKINLQSHASSPAKILLNGDFNFNPLSNAAAVIANVPGAANSGRIDLGGVTRTFNVGDGTAPVDLAVSVPIINGGVIKSGAGALVLTGANTYAGDTTVQAGKLSLGTPFLNNSADVFLTTGSTLDLTFSGLPDTIDSLFIDDVSMAAGEWGAEGSGAINTSPLITGTGKLLVTTFIPAPSPADFNADQKVDEADLALWTGGFGAGANATHEMGDADGDFDVDGFDFLTWQQDYGHGVTATAAAVGVPEPSSAFLIAAAACVFASARRRPCVV